MAGRRGSLELRPLHQADLAPLAAWLPRAAADAGCAAWEAEDALCKAVAKQNVLTGAEGAPESFLAYEIDTPQRNAAWVRLLAVAPGRRRLGIGQRAVLALEERLAGSISRLYVLVPAKLGLALYFWLRLGYRPLTQREWPTQPEAGPAVWMVRELG